jgi:hypothetical protein
MTEEAPGHAGMSRADTSHARGVGEQACEMRPRPAPKAADTEAPSRSETNWSAA